MTLPSRPTLAIEPLPSTAHGSPSMLETYSTLRFSSKRTDSGTFSDASDSHILVSLCAVGD
jgi:hypothetical protein